MVQHIYFYKNDYDKQLTVTFFTEGLNGYTNGNKRNLKFAVDKWNDFRKTEKEKIFFTEESIPSHFLNEYKIVNNTTKRKYND